MNVPRWFLPDVMLRTVIIEGILEAVSPLHFGTGRPSILNEFETAKIITEDEEIPYIPSTAIRGLLRIHSEKLARALGHRVCGGFGRESCASKILNNGRNLTEIIDELLIKNRGLEAIELLWKEICVICKVFGAPRYESRITTYNALPISPNSVGLGHKVIIAIDRGTGTEIPGSSKVIEYIQPGSRFKFRIDLINLPNYLMGLISSVLMDINIGIARIGGYRSKGFGVISIKNPRILIIHHSDESGNETVLRALDENDEDIKITETTLTGAKAENLLRKLASLWLKRAKALE